MARIARVLVATLLATSIAQPASAAARAKAKHSKPQLRGPNVVTYPMPDIEIAQAERILRQGTRFRGGCSYVLPEPMTGHEMIEVEVQYNPDNCQSIFLRGILLSSNERGPMYTDSNPAQDGESIRIDRPGYTSVQTVGVVNASATTDGNELPSAAMGELPDLDPRALDGVQDKWAYSWSWFDEPFRWGVLFCQDVANTTGCVLPSVNWVKNTIHWTPDGSCAIHPGTAGQAFQDFYMLELTGWGIETSSWDRTSNNQCKSAFWSNSYFTFENNFFCQNLIGILCGVLPVCAPPPAPTFTLYNPNGITGYADGTKNFTSNLAKWGGCEALLRAGHRWGDGTG